MMNVRFWIGLIAGLTLCTSLQAQPATLKWGMENAISKRYRVEKLLGANEELLYVLLSQPEGLNRPETYFLAAYNRGDFSEQFINPVIIPRNKGDKTDLENILYINDQLILFSTYYNESVATNNAVAHFIGADGKVTDQSVLLHEFRGANNRNRGLYDFQLSRDSSRILVHFKKPYDKNTRETLTYRVYDWKLNPLWSKSIDLPYSDQEFEPVEYAMDEEDNVFLLGKVSNPDRKWIKGKPNFHYVLISYNHATNEVHEFDIDLKERSISDIHMAFDQNGQLLVAGLYSKLARFNDEAVGTFFLRIDRQRKTLTSRMIQAFDRKLLLEFMNERQLEKGQELQDFQVRKLITTPQGETFMLAEQYYFKRDCMTDYRTGLQNCTDQYHFNNLLVVQMDSLGQLGWVSLVEKSQYSTDDFGIFSSFIAGLQGDRLHLIFNDHPKNQGTMIPDKVKGMVMPRSSIIRDVVVDHQGAVVQREALDNMRQNTAVFVPRIRLTLSPSSFIVVSRFGTTIRFGEVKIEQAP